MHLIFKVILFFCFITKVFSVGARFLILPVGADNLSIGAHSSLGGSPNTNPALLGTSRLVSSLSFDTGVWFSDTKISNLHYRSFLKSTNMKLLVRYAGITELEFRGESPSDNPESYYPAYGISLEALLSRKLGKSSRVGVNFKRINFSIYDQSSTGFGFDLGYHKVFDSQLNLGASILNFGKISKLNKEIPNLPFMTSIGLSKNLDIKNISCLALFSTSYEIDSNISSLNLANKLSWKKFQINIGAQKSKDTAAFSFGTGVNVANYNIFYAFKIGNQLIGIPQTLSIQIAL